MQYAATPPRIQPSQSIPMLSGSPQANTATGTMIAIETKANMADTAASSMKSSAPSTGYSMIMSLLEASTSSRAACSGFEAATTASVTHSSVSRTARRQTARCCERRGTRHLLERGCAQPAPEPAAGCSSLSTA